MGYIKRKSARQESLTAKEFGGRVTPASGALSGSKGDVKTDRFLIENKFTDDSKYKLELKTWKKIDKEATREGLRMPMMQIDIQDLSLIVLDYHDVSSLFPKGAMVHKSFFNTPHQSVTLHKKDFAYLEDESTLHTITFGDGRKTHLTVLSKKQYFLLDRS